MIVDFKAAARTWNLEKGKKWLRYLMQAPGSCYNLQNGPTYTKGNSKFEKFDEKIDQFLNTVVP